MGEVDRDREPDEEGPARLASKDGGSAPVKQPGATPALVPERSNTPTMPWGVDVAPTPLRPSGRVVAPAPHRESAPDPSLPPKLKRSLSSAGRPAVSPALERRVPPKQEVVRLPRQARAEPYALEAQLASHLAWLDEDGQKDLFRHLSKGDHGKALSMMATAKTNYPKNVSITRATQIIERAAIARLLARLGPSHAVGKYDLRAASKDARSIGQLFDGDTTLDEALRASKLPRLRTLEILWDLVTSGSLVLEDPTATPGVTDASSRASHMRPRVEASLPDWSGEGDDSARLTLPDPIETATRAATLRDEIEESRRLHGGRRRADTPVATSQVKEALQKSASLDLDLPSALGGGGLPSALGGGDLPSALGGGGDVPAALGGSPRAVSAGLGSAARGSTLRFGDVELGPLPGASPKNDAPTRRPPSTLPLDLDAPVIPKAPAIARDLADPIERGSAPTRREGRRLDPRSEGSQPPPADTVFPDDHKAPSASVREPEPKAPATKTLPAAARASAPPATSSAASALAIPLEAPAASARLAHGVSRRGPPWATIVLGAVAVAAVGIAIYYATRDAPPPVVARTGEATSTATAATAASTAIASPTSTATAAETAQPTAAAGIAAVDLQIDVTPKFAVVYVDNVLLTGRPINKRIARDDVEHEVRIEAPGYRPLKTKFNGNGDTHLILALEPLPKVVAPPPPGGGGDDSPYN